ncbi:MAG: thiamine pyrophosphate-binding protein [Chloroflexi bacterium]|nr:thiamine pyrophosphate-binding protein [Chloroflexota bacterium]
MSEKKKTSAEEPLVLKPEEFIEKVVRPYNTGIADLEMPAELHLARSLIPPGTAALRDFSYISPEIPRFNSQNCTGCMECVTQCPDTAILAKVVPMSVLEQELGKVGDASEREHLRQQFAVTTKYYRSMEKRGEEPGFFGIFIDPTKCKGCAECVAECGERNALSMITKDHGNILRYRSDFTFFKKLPQTPEKYIYEKSLADMMLADRSLLYVGGAGSCMGCGEATSLRMLLTATGFVHGPNSIAIVAATGCNTVFAATYPYNSYKVPWTNSLFENAPTVAMGIRARWDMMGWKDKMVWAIGGDGAMLDIGFQALSRMLMSGMNVKALILDTQVYSNTGGQASTGSYLGQDSKMAAFGGAVPGKQERRKEMGLIAMMHPNIFVAQTTPAHVNHFYKSVIAANEFPGPALVNCYAACMPEHGIGDSMASHQARLAVDSRAFPLFTYDPRKGAGLRERLDLSGNPARDKDWYVNPKTEEVIDFVYWARTEGRFARHFGKDGKPSPTLLASREERLQNWRLLQELAGMRSGDSKGPVK